MHELDFSSSPSLSNTSEKFDALKQSSTTTKRPHRNKTIHGEIQFDPSCELRETKVCVECGIRENGTQIKHKKSCCMNQDRRKAPQINNLRASTALKMAS